MQVTHHTILITGGSEGIGLDLAAALLGRGNRVAICGRSEEKLSRARNQYPELKTIACDVAREEDCRRMVDQLRADGWTLTILINNAGIARPVHFARDAKAGASTEQEIQVNLLGPVRLTALVLPDLLNAPEAAIVNVSSGFALWPFQGSPGYCASKAGLHFFTRSLRTQLEKTNIRVMEALPPVVDTAFTEQVKTSKLPVSKVTRDIIRGLERDKKAVYIGLVGVLRWCVPLCPWLVDIVLRRYPVTMKEVEALYEENPTDAS